MVIVPDALKGLLVSLEDLTPSPRNPRNGHNVQGIVRALEEFGWHAPIVARAGTGEIIIGHGRYAASQQLGLEYVPALLVNDDEAKAYARMVADNRLNEQSEWDADKLQFIIDQSEELLNWTLELDLDALVKVEVSQALATVPPIEGLPPVQYQNTEAMEPTPLPPVEHQDPSLVNKRVIITYTQEEELDWLADRLGDLVRSQIVCPIKDLAG